MYSYIFHFDIIISLTTPIIDYYLAYITPSYLPILKKKERMIIKIPTLLADILSSDQTAKAQQICLKQCLNRSYHSTNLSIRFR